MLNAAGNSWELLVWLILNYSLFILFSRIIRHYFPFCSNPPIWIFTKIWWLVSWHEDSLFFTLHQMNNAVLRSILRLVLNEASKCCWQQCLVLLYWLASLARWWRCLPYLLLSSSLAASYYQHRAQHPDECTCCLPRALTRARTFIIDARRGCSQIRVPTHPELVYPHDARRGWSQIRVPTHPELVYPHHAWSLLESSFSFYIIPSHPDCCTPTHAYKSGPLFHFKLYPLPDSSCKSPVFSPKIIPSHPGYCIPTHPCLRPLQFTLKLNYVV
jgi:hypothetical protein